MRGYTDGGTFCLPSDSGEPLLLRDVFPAFRTMPSSARQMEDGFGWENTLHHPLRVKEYAKNYLGTTSHAKTFLSAQRGFVTHKRQALTHPVKLGYSRNTRRPFSDCSF